MTGSYSRYFLRRFFVVMVFCTYFRIPLNLNQGHATAHHTTLDICQTGPDDSALTSKQTNITTSVDHARNKTTDYTVSAPSVETEHTTLI